jgi:hypothetical protein
MSATDLGYDLVQKEMKEGLGRRKDPIRFFALDLVQPPYLLKFALFRLAISPRMEQTHPKDVIAVLKAGSAVLL